MPGYQPGRGYSGRGGRSGGQGFWASRPEFTGAASNYDRMTIRSLVPARGASRAGYLLANAAAVAGGQYRNYRKRGGAEGVRQRMEEGGEYLARGIDLLADKELGAAPGTVRSAMQQERLRPAAGSGEGFAAPSGGWLGNTGIDLEEAGAVAGKVATYAKSVVGHPMAASVARGAVKGAAKGSMFGGAGMMLGAVRGAAKEARKSSEQSIWATPSPPGPEPPL